MRLTCSCGADIALDRARQVDENRYACGCGRQYGVVVLGEQVHVQHYGRDEAVEVPVRAVDVPELGMRGLWKTLSMLFMLRQLAERDAERFGLRLPRRQRHRNWRFAINRVAKNCECCGRLIEPYAPHYEDWVTGHLVRHADCHDRAEADGSEA